MHCIASRALSNRSFLRFRASSHGRYVSGPSRKAERSVRQAYGDALGIDRAMAMASPHATLFASISDVQKKSMAGGAISLFSGPAGAHHAGLYDRPSCMLRKIVLIGRARDRAEGEAMDIAQLDEIDDRVAARCRVAVVEDENGGPVWMPGSTRSRQVLPVVADGGRSDLAVIRRPLASGDF